MAAKQVIKAKILVNKETNQIIFAEAGKEFVDLLFSFLTLPLGTISRLAQKPPPSSSPRGIGCTNNIYKSLQNIDAHHLRSEACKAQLLAPKRAAEPQCKKLKLKLEDPGPSAVTQCGVDDDDDDGVFVRGEPSMFMITDDLRVMPVSMSTCFSLLHKLGIKNINTAEERTVEIGREEVAVLLMRSLLSKSPLTEALFGVRLVNGTKSDKKEEFVMKVKQHIMTNLKGIEMKLMLRKSDNKVLFAEAKEEFVYLVFSFLTLPLGAILKLLDGNSSMGCIDNLYKSVEDLSVGNYLKSDTCKAMLICPELTPLFDNENQFNQTMETLDLRLYYESLCRETLRHGFSAKACYGGSSHSSRSGVKFMKGPAAYLITDNLVVTPLSPISGMSLLKSLDVPINDVEERVVSIGKEEARLHHPLLCMIEDPLSFEVDENCKMYSLGTEITEGFFNLRSSFKCSLQ